MLLPIALLYTNTGTISAVRYLKFYDKSNIDYNLKGISNLLPNCMNGANIIEIPITEVKIRWKRDNFVMSARLTKLDADGKPISTDYTQAVTHCDTSNQTVFLVDYKGNILKTTLDIAYNLERNHKIRFGNRLCFSFRPYPPLSVLEPVNFGPDYNKQADRLTNFSTLMGKSSPAKEGFKLEHLTSDISTVMVPDGAKSLKILNSEAPIKDTCSSIQKVICPQQLDFVDYDMPNDKLDVFKSPIFIKDHLSICCDTLHQFIPPQQCTGTYAKLKLDLKCFSPETLTLPKAVEYRLNINNAPNLKSICGFLDGLYSAYVAISNAPNFKTLTLGVRQGYSHKQSYADVSVYIGVKTYKITLLEPIQILRLVIPPQLENCEITVEHVGIKYLEYLNTSATNKIVFIDKQYRRDNLKYKTPQPCQLTAELLGCSVSPRDLCPIL